MPRKPIQRQPFVDACPPIGGMSPADDPLIAKYKGLLPDALLELWAVHGFGRYGSGLVELINPDVYRPTLYRWLMRDWEDPSRLPIALSAFGSIFYYRRLSDEDEDVSCVDPSCKETAASVCTWSLADFFNGCLTDQQFCASMLGTDLIDEAVPRLGTPDLGELFAFEPSLRLGGQRRASSLRRANSLVHHDFLYQLATS